MYDMLDDEILGFWGKRPFIGKGIARPKERKDSEPLKLPVLSSRTETASEPPLRQPELLSSWHFDPVLFRRWRPPPTANGFSKARSADAEVRD
jgi:hypothetical protein